MTMKNYLIRIINFFLIGIALIIIYFTYKKGNELIKANKDCRELWWYTETFRGWPIMCFDKEWTTLLFKR